MSTLSDAVSAVREVIKLTDDVKRAGETLKELAIEIREHDRRITRLEAQWDTALKLSTGRGFNQLPDK
jgi:vacuolar-type H+-ATPase subunit D/Vma8